MSNYKYDGIAPLRSVYDTIYLQFIRLSDRQIIYRKALRWDLKKSVNDKLKEGERK